jgi:transposase-like protein
MVLIPVLCPHCHTDKVIKGGKTKTGTQRYKCEKSRLSSLFLST